MTMCVCFTTVIHVLTFALHTRLKKKKNPQFLNGEGILSLWKKGEYGLHSYCGNTYIRTAQLQREAAAEF